MNIDKLRDLMRVRVAELDYLIRSELKEYNPNYALIGKWQREIDNIETSMDTILEFAKGEIDARWKN